MIVGDKLSDDPDVFAAGRRHNLMRWRRIMARFLPGMTWGPYRDFNPDLRPAVKMDSALSAIGASIDIICLHWITGLLSAEMIAGLGRRFRCPVVWTLTDQEPYTGGCHYTYECQGYTAQCGRCPQLKSARVRDRSRLVWNNKHRHLAPLPIAFVSSCHWTSERFRESSLFGQHRLEEIGDAIDTTVFRPFNKKAARDLMHVPEDVKVIFFGAFSVENPRKGMKYLAEALRSLASEFSGMATQPFLLCAGREPHAMLKSLPYRSRSLGYLKDDVTLALAYQAADLFICPSIYEAGAMMVPESMLCGTPVVAFDTGNAPDLIRNMETGYRAIYQDSSDLARGIAAMLSAPNLLAIGEAAGRQARQRHAPEFVARRHTALFSSIKSEWF